MMGECLVAPHAARLASGIGSSPIRNLGDGEGGRGEQEGWMEEEDGGVGTLFRMEGWTAKGERLDKLTSLLLQLSLLSSPPSRPGRPFTPR